MYALVRGFNRSGDIRHAAVNGSSREAGRAARDRGQLLHRVPRGGLLRGQPLRHREEEPLEPLALLVRRIHLHSALLRRPLLLQGLRVNFLSYGSVAFRGAVAPTAAPPPAGVRGVCERAESIILNYGSVAFRVMICESPRSNTASETPRVCKLPVCRVALMARRCGADDPAAL